VLGYRTVVQRERERERQVMFRFNAKWSGGLLQNLLYRNTKIILKNKKRKK
jgi:hypothetical protein